MRWRRVAHRLPLTGVAVAGAVVGHMVAYVLAVPAPTERVALLGATGHAYWTAAIAAALVLGLTSLAATLGRRFRAGRPRRWAGPGETAFPARVRLDTSREADYYRHGGVLPYVLRTVTQGRRGGPGGPGPRPG